MTYVNVTPRVLCVNFYLQKAKYVIFIVAGGRTFTTPQEELKMAEDTSSAIPSFVLFDTAIERNDLEAVRVFVEDGEDFEAHNSMGRSALTQAVVCARGEILQILITAGANVNAQTRELNYPITIAAFKGYYGIVKQLIAAGADVNVYDRFDCTALMNARRQGHFHIEKILLSAGAKESS